MCRNNKRHTVSIQGIVSHSGVDLKIKKVTGNSVNVRNDKSNLKLYCRDCKRKFPSGKYYISRLSFEFIISTIPLSVYGYDVSTLLVIECMSSRKNMVSTL